MVEQTQGITEAALYAIRQGYQPLPIQKGGKRPYGTSWTHTRWDKDISEEEVGTFFAEMEQRGAPGLGLLLGEPSGGDRNSVV